MTDLSMFLLGVYDTDDPETGLTGQFCRAGATNIKPMGSRRAMAYAAERGLIVPGRDKGALEDPMQGIPPSADAAQFWFDNCFKPYLKGQPASLKLVYWEDAYNELGDLEDPDTLKGFNDFEVKRQQIMRDWGYRCCIGNFSAEANLYDKVEPFLPAIRLAAKYGNLLGLHAYGSPRLDDLGVASFVFPEEALAARLSILGEPMPAIANTEFGIDEILSLNRHYAGWRTTGCTGTDYLTQLAVAAERKARKGFVKAISTFVDDTDPSGNWVQYNTHGGKPARPKQYDPGEPPVTLEMLGYIKAHAGAIELPAPPPVTPATALPYEATVTVDGLNLRDGSLDASRLIKALPVRTLVTVLDDGRRVNVRVVLEGTVLKSGLRPKGD